jgi:ABC-type nitrate/sulfonate/bicarbonate transport system ATPase subunit
MEGTHVMDRPDEQTRPAALKVDRLSFTYGGHLVLHDISFTVRPGEFVSVIGPSGCGKSTLLQIIAGILPPGLGSVDVATNDGGSGLSRAVVFQDFALMPWKTVRANVGLGLDYMRPRQPKRERARRAQEAINVVGLRGFEDKYPYQVSGGMKQRTGIARALAVNPTIFLLDEPMASVDAQNAELLRTELRSLIANQDRTALLVTHNLDEALYLSDRILLMTTKPGRIVEDIPVERLDTAGSEEAESLVREQHAALRERIWAHLKTEVTRERLA